MAQSGWETEQFVAQPGEVAEVVVVDAGQGLQQAREVPASGAAHREDLHRGVRDLTLSTAAMEPGHEDREDRSHIR